MTENAAEVAEMTENAAGVAGTEPAGAELTPETEDLYEALRDVMDPEARRQRRRPWPGLRRDRGAGPHGHH